MADRIISMLKAMDLFEKVTGISLTQDENGNIRSTHDAIKILEDKWDGLPPDLKAALSHADMSITDLRVYEKLEEIDTDSLF